MIVLAVVTTILVGWIGTAFGHDMLNGFNELGSIMAVACMGVFIMIDNRRKNK